MTYFVVTFQWAVTLCQAHLALQLPPTTMPNFKIAKMDYGYTVHQFNIRKFQLSIKGEKKGTK